MKIDVKKTNLFYIFGSPVTVKRTENIVISGLECLFAQLCVCDSVKIAMKPVDGSITLKPYELMNGTYELRAVDENRNSIDIGTVSITDTFATVSEISASKAIDKLALWAEKIDCSLEKVVRTLDQMDKEIHCINLLK